MRYEKKLTEKQLARLCGLSQSYLSDLELCKKSPTLRVVEQIAIALNVHPLELLEFVDEL
ncbi:helix-turn-helix domain-containing protein [Clostridium beijerinckii]|uniref:helix-turn-helix domain-containing protein n=1 Tax=Clostridium beijerinckii TaxID=1520 RepID=UPI00232C189E|nr:helix-turn-helix transcriptional regulator [Clostridium beijerinckii]